MPGMNGDEVMAHLKTIPDINTPVIVLTADITVSPEKMLEEGFFGFLSKPLDKDSLWNGMNKALSKNKKS